MKVSELIQVLKSKNQDHELVIAFSDKNGYFTETTLEIDSLKNGTNQVVFEVYEEDFTECKDD